MIPTRMIRKHMEEAEGPELDQLLVSLYQTCMEIHRPILPRDGAGREQRMERFDRWLRHTMLKANEDLETTKLESVFAQDLPRLREIWEKVKAAEAAGEKDET